MVEGEKMVLELLRHPTFLIEEIFALDSWVENHVRELARFEKILCRVSEKELEKISGLSTPNKVLAVVEIPDSTASLEKTSSLILYLDGLQDPGNMGAILRNADWFGVSHVICSDTSVDIYNPKVIQSSMGAFLRVNSCEMDFEQLRKQLPAYSSVGATMQGDNLYQQHFPPQTILVIGNEGNGISPSILDQLDHRYSIPGRGGAESLNAGVAAGIFCAMFHATFVR